MVVLVATGKGAAKAFHNEGGGHRWQRTPPTEKRGRTHTSTVTVAVLPLAQEHQTVIDERDLEWKTCRGSGAGGQHRNTTDSAVQLTHLPSKLSVRCEGERSQHQNKATALALLHARLHQASLVTQQDARNDHRKQQVGTAMRGDKRRTIAMQRDQVHDHITDKRMSVKAYLRGELEVLW